MFTLTAVLKAKPGKEAALEAALRDLVAQVTANEPAALTYTLHKSATAPGTFFFFEQYEDEAAFKRHNSMPYIKAMGKVKEELMDGDTILSFYEELAAIDR